MAINDNTSYELTGAQVKDLANKIKAKAADNIFVGATSAAPGSKGLVPQPQAGDDTKFLSGDGTWKTVSGGSSPSYIYIDIDDFPSSNQSTYHMPVYKDAACTNAYTQQEFLGLSFEDGIIVAVSFTGLTPIQIDREYKAIRGYEASSGPYGYEFYGSGIGSDTAAFRAFYLQWDTSTSNVKFVIDQADYVKKLSSNESEIILGSTYSGAQSVSMPDHCPLAPGVLHDGGGQAMFNNNRPSYLTFTVTLPAPFADFTTANYALVDPNRLGPPNATMEVQFTDPSRPTSLLTLTIDSTYYQQFGQYVHIEVMQNNYVYTSMVNVTLPLPSTMNLYASGPTTVMIKNLEFEPSAQNFGNTNTPALPD